MKSAVFALLLAPAVQAKFTIERSLQVCPSSSSDVMCTADFTPVKCGSTACEYSNQCGANAAGFTPAVCWPATCDAPSVEIACTLDLNPVLCGDQKCAYDNYCLAQAAGFPPTVCEAVNCPAPPAMVACTYEMDPFVCFELGVGLCTYDNGCIATQSGFNIGAGQCVRTIEFIANNLGECPLVGLDGTVCPLLYDPVRCGDCAYANECEAFSAGFDAADPFACQSATCALPGDGIACTADFTPVRCGPEGCTYSNQCEADTAGYTVEDCGDANCPAPDLSVVCSREYDPHTCTLADTGAECTYDNLCAAGAAGQSEANCVSLVDPVNPDICPVSDPVAQCTREVDEIFCGKDDCFYSNYCIANAAGYQNLDCRSANCPASTATMDDCGDFPEDTKLCGPYNCPYFSSCTANRAGWAPVECTEVECPVGTGSCTLEYQPIVCAESEYAGGAPCAYSNECLAGLAGYNTLEIAGQCVRPLLTAPTRSVSFDPVALNATAMDGDDMDGDAGAMDGDTINGDADGDADEDGHGHEHDDEDSDSDGAPSSPPALESSGAVSLIAAKGSLVALALAYFVV